MGDKMEFVETHTKALKDVKTMIDHLENDRWYYEADIEYEYTSFEINIKKYCDLYCEVYISNDESELFFDSLTKIVEAIVECNADMYDEDFSRPAELITYYFGKIISSDDDLKEHIYNWLLNFCEEYEGDMLVEDYFRHFINGEKIYHADNYYTEYKDLNRMMRVFK